MAKRTYATLDGLRGVAAICIVVLHGYRYYFDVLPAAQMAVDLFFVLSGFVLCHSYASRLDQGMSPRTFVLLRIARLYPIFLVGILLGMVGAVAAIYLQLGSVEWTWRDVLISAPFNLLMLPTPLSGIEGTLFPLNGVMWTIFLELVVNAIWAATHPFLRSTRVLVAVIVASGTLFSAVALAQDTTALGTKWSTVPGGLLRVLFSFMLGVLIYRYHERLRVPRVHPLLLVSILPGLSMFDLSTPLQLLCALLVFPAVVLLGSHTEPKGLVRRGFLVLGVASYAVYALHKRLYDLSVGFFLQVFGLEVERYAPWPGLVFLIGLVAVSAFLAVHYEPPFRRWLSRQFTLGGVTGRVHAPDSEQPVRTLGAGLRPRFRPRGD